MVSFSSFTYTDTGALGMVSAAASFGLSLLWDTEVGLSHVDKYTYSSEEHIKVYLSRPSVIITLIHYF